VSGLSGKVHKELLRSRLTSASAMRSTRLKEFHGGILEGKEIGRILEKNTLWVYSVK